MKEKYKVWMKEHAQEYVEDLRYLVSIPSVSVQQPEDREAPFGEPCARVLKAMLTLGEKYGFETNNYGNRVGRIIYKEENGEDIGVWNHLDVVPPGPGWLQDPYTLQEKEGWLIGRGVTDNKGPALASL